MKVFILGTGRTGTVTFSKACRHIINYTSAHESPFDNHYLHFPNKHIEINPRLAWMMGPLVASNVPEDTLYVHLQRRKQEVIRSWDRRGKNMGPGRWTLLGLGATPGSLSEDKWKKACGLCYDTIVSTVDTFLKTQPNTMHIWLHELEEKWPEFWKAIDARGDYQYSLKELKKRYNAS